MRSAAEISASVQTAARELLGELASVEQLVTGLDDQGAIYERLAAALDHCLAQLATLNLWGPENRLPSSELWTITGHLLERSFLLKRARIKPRGYAGDYEMLAAIYENRRCDDPFGRLLDRYFQEQAAPQAVRNRMRMMREWIVEIAKQTPGVSRKRVAVVGSALGVEVRDALLTLVPANRQRVDVALLDLDPAAIDFARAQLATLLPQERLTAVSANVFRLPDRPQMAAHLARSDLLLCPGLFDYLDDMAAVAMLRTLYAQLATGGQLIVFQFAPHNPTRTYMEWLGNWYLIYRDARQLHQIAAAAGIGDILVRVGAEPLGVDLYLAVTQAHLNLKDDQPGQSRKTLPTSSPSNE
jgi:extracellular factor (EF) 3-hydroxypalmitic acid methyl ester biosynthesis protein